MTLKRADVPNTKGDTLRAFYSMIRSEHSSACACRCEILPGCGDTKRTMWARVVLSIMDTHGIDEYVPGETSFAPIHLPS